MKTNHRIRNEFYFQYKSCEKDFIEKCTSDKININEIKESIAEKRAREAGISNGKPFETICSKVLDWIRFTTIELEISVGKVFKKKNLMSYTVFAVYFLSPNQELILEKS